eukprot:scaffold49162_cov48-Prasinocladus_malaysianus.AAC.2
MRSHRIRVIGLGLRHIATRRSSGVQSSGKSCATDTFGSSSSTGCRPISAGLAFGWERHTAFTDAYTRIYRDSSCSSKGCLVTLDD